MIFFLTGEVQTGKTRWLQNAIKEFQDAGIEVHGIVSPGVWREEEDPETGETSYVKEGITATLLPGGETFPFAITREAAREQGIYDEESQSARSGIEWAVDEEAIARVNKHFDKLDAKVAPSPLFLVPPHGPSAVKQTPSNVKPALLVIDELGQMELLRSMGIMSAVRLIDRGKNAQYPHAVVVVRKSLLDTASSYFVKTKWGGMAPLFPDDESLHQLKHAFGLE